MDNIRFLNESAMTANLIRQTVSRESKPGGEGGSPEYPWGLLQKPKRCPAVFRKTKLLAAARDCDLEICAGRVLELILKVD